jgi:DNA-directed RNA polymerase beta subunit
MTVSHFLEGLLAKPAALLGSATRDATPFGSGQPAAEGAAACLAAGVQTRGEEVLYSGRTGEQLGAAVFVAPTYVMRLKHMARDKVGARGGLAPVDAVTRQPTKGRANEGGGRIGGMELDALCGHGLLGFVKEGAVERADGFDIAVQRGAQGGEPAVWRAPLGFQADAGAPLEPESADAGRFDVVRATYVLKQLQHELATAGVGLRLVAARGGAAA